MKLAERLGCALRAVARWVACRVGRCMLLREDVPPPAAAPEPAPQLAAIALAANRDLAAALDRLDRRLPEGVGAVALLVADGAPALSVAAGRRPGLEPRTPPRTESLIWLRPAPARREARGQNSCRSHTGVPRGR